MLLLDATEAYHREISRSQGEIPPAVSNLLPRLRDASYTSVAIVTLPEATPVLKQRVYRKIYNVPDYPLIGGLLIRHFHLLKQLVQH